MFHIAIGDELLSDFLDTFDRSTNQVPQEIKP